VTPELDANAHVVRGALAAVLTLLVGCGPAQPHTVPGEGERVPITSRAIAAVMLDHLSSDTTTRQATWVDADDPTGMIGADLRYDGGAEDDGDLVRVALAPGQFDGECERSRCAMLDTDIENATLRLEWATAVPGEDPGAVWVVLQRDHEYLYVYESGPRITKDPRELHLPISVEELVSVAEDPWLCLRTSPDAIEAGTQVDHWQGR
jgi:hypothetical protein